ncbi:hypothetical protein C8R44DRAFT_625825 [Mycena epipterygia]|nr:hypothetical protein C8R44DRAFT_625825 [Mycena epipterygia]
MPHFSTTTSPPHWFVARNPLFILDVENRIVAIFAGTPEDPEWPEVIQDTVAALTQAREDALSSGALSTADTLNRRGDYLQITKGASHGGGQKRPGMLVLAPFLKPIADRICANKSVRRICGFQSSILANFAPKVYKDFAIDLKALFEQLPHLQHNFRNSIFPTVTFNCGPNTATVEHRDSKNRPDAFCGITCGGKFNPRTSALLYLKQFRLVVEFPSGSSTLIPSATVDHGNTPLQLGETRCSITQYAAGALFCSVKYGFKNGKQLLHEKGGAARKAAFDGAPGERARRGLDLLSKPEELAADRASVFTVV